MIEKMNRFKQLDLVVNWMLSIFFVLLAGANFLFERQLLALLGERKISGEMRDTTR